MKTIANKQKRAFFSSSSSDSEEANPNGRSVTGEQRRTQLEQLLKRKRLNHSAGNYTSSDGNRRRTRNSLPRAAAAGEITVGSGSEGYLDKEEDDGESDDEEFETDNKATLVDSMDMRRSSSRRRTRHSSGSSSLKAVPRAIRHHKKAYVSFGLDKDDESIVDVKRSSSLKKAPTSRLLSSETEDAEASDDAVIISSKKIPIPITEFTESEESEQDHAQSRATRKANLLRLQRKVTGEPPTSSEEENENDEEVEEEEFDSDDAQLAKPKASSTPRGRVLRSMGTEVEILSLPSDSATPSDASSDSQEIVRKKKKRKRKSCSSSKRKSLIVDDESDVLESNLEDIVNTEDEWEDSTAGTSLYCNICEEFFGKDNFSMEQQKYGGDDRFCLLHTWAGGMVRAEDYNDELDARVNRSKRWLKSMEDRYQLNEKTLGESDYESDGFIIKELDE